MPGITPRARLVLRAGILVALLLVLLALAAGVSAQEGDITRGSQIYDANCAVCHGSEGQGRIGANLSGAFPAIDPEAFARATVEQGIPGSTMPAWSQQHGGPLDDQEIEDVVAFVTSLSGGRSPMAPTATPLPVTPVPTVPGATGDPGHGRALFVENCAMCHGERGQGLVGANLNKAFASFNPQQFVRATVSDGITGTAMPAWSQAKGGPLAEQEIDDISAYIVTLAATAPQATATPAPTAQATSGGLPWWLLVLLTIIVVVVVIALIMQFSGRGTT